MLFCPEFTDLQVNNWAEFKERMLWWNLSNTHSWEPLKFCETESNLTRGAAGTEGHGRPRRATEGHGWSRTAMDGHGQPRMPMDGHGGPLRVTEGPWLKPLASFYMQMMLCCGRPAVWWADVGEEFWSTSGASHHQFMIWLVSEQSWSRLQK